MLCIERDNFFNAGLLMVYKHFKVDRSQQIEIDLVFIVPYGHDKGTVLV
jgi:hypothetical protein